MKASERILVVTSRPEWQWKRSGCQDDERNWSRVWGPSDANRLMEEGTARAGIKPCLMPGGPKPADSSASPERLYSEIGRLKMELSCYY